MEKRLNIFYDEESDVFYFSKGEPTEDVESREIGDDIIIRLNSQTSEVVGFTILNLTKRFKENKNIKYIPVNAEFALAV